VISKVQNDVRNWNKGDDESEEYPVMKECCLRGFPPFHYEQANAGEIVKARRSRIKCHQAINRLQRGADRAAAVVNSR
jgi:hypothetical protein